MQILTIDVGTGTQDVFLFDSDREVENGYKLVMPSPTASIARRIRAATAAGEPLLLEGVTMGGGPCHWAAMDHLRARLPLYATAEAARTFDDDLEQVAAMGVRVIGEDEARRLPATRVRLHDLWLDQVLDTFRAFEADAHPDALAVAVFDHGAAPPGYSDRIFRFDYLRERLTAGTGLAGFAFRADEVPPAMTRLRAVVGSAPPDLPLVVMDTAPAAVLGALEDPRVSSEPRAIVANVGNFHCLAFHLAEGRIAGLFEHHTGEVTPRQLGGLVQSLASGTLTNREVYESQGHGALVLEPEAPAPRFVAATGPRRQVLVDSGLGPYLAVPHGDMMLAGNFGLLRACAALEPDWRAAVEGRLGAPPAATLATIAP